MPSGGYRSRGSVRGASIAMSAPTDYIRRDADDAHDDAGEGAGLRGWPPRPCRNRGGRWSQCSRASMGAVDPLATKGVEHTSARGHGSQAEERHEGLADEVVGDVVSAF